MNKELKIKSLQKFCKDKKIMSKLNLIEATLEQISNEFQSDDMQFDAISLRANNLKRLMEMLRKRIGEVIIEEIDKKSLFNNLLERLKAAGYNAKQSGNTLQLEVYNSNVSNAWAICIVSPYVWGEPNVVKVVKMFGKIEDPFISASEDDLFNHIVQLCNEYIARQNLIECKTS